MSIFEPPELVKLCEVYQICSMYASTMMFRISIQDGIKLYYPKIEIPTEMVVEGLYKSKLQDSVHRRLFETVDSRALPD